MKTYMPINIIFDGPPGPECGRFIEVETDDGKSINAGEWIEREDGLWALRVTSLPDIIKDMRHCTFDGQCSGVNVGCLNCEYFRTTQTKKEVSK